MKFSKQQLIRIGVIAAIVLAVALLVTVLVLQGVKNSDSHPVSSSPSSEASQSFSNVSSSTSSQSVPQNASNAQSGSSSHSTSKSSSASHSASQSSSASAGASSTLPQSYSVSVAAGNSSLNIGASTKVTVTVLKDGSPAPDGTPVLFDVSNSTVGSLSGATPTTKDGIASATFSAKGAGQATVTATAQGVQSSGSITVVSTYNFNFSSSFTAPLLYNTGSPTVSVIISQNGSPVSQGTKVHWSVDGGGISLGQTVSTTNTNGLASIPLSFVTGYTGNTVSAWVEGSTQKGTFSIATQDTYEMSALSSTNVVLSPPSTAQQTFSVSLLKNGAAFNGGTVKWSYGGDLPGRNLFTLSDNQSISGADGIASITGGLTSPEVGTAVVEAVFTGGSTSVKVSFNFTSSMPD
ncbi:MAG: hypothetical protein ACK5JF_00860 [Oscillospiraceae bacterium]